MKNFSEAGALDAIPEYLDEELIKEHYEGVNPEHLIKIFKINGLGYFEQLAWSRAETGSITDASILFALIRQVAEARLWARHGYEIGQRSATWTEDVPAPEWIRRTHD